MKSSTPLSARPRRLMRSIALLGLAATLLGGCGSDPEQLVASARQYIAGNDPKAAVIQLKNALQEKPEHAEARFLLGELNLKLGDSATAAKEFERARSAGYSEQQVVPLLARALVNSGEAKKALEQFRNTTLSEPAAAATLSAALGDAHLLAGAAAEAEVAFKAALAANPAELRAVIGMARIEAGKGDLAAAKARLNAIIASSPSADAHSLLAAIALAENDPEAAKSSYAKAIAADPKQATAHFALISLLLREGRIDDAKAALAEMKKGVGGANLYPVYLQAYLDFVEQKDKQAAEGIAQVLRSAPDFLPARLLAGSVHLRMRDLNQARQHLGVVLSAQPQNPLARRLMVSVHLLARESDRAIELLEPLLRQFPDDVTVLSLAGQAHLAKGDFVASSEYFAKAVEKNPQDSAARARLGVSRLGSGDVDQAFVDLEKAASLDEHGVRADVAVAMARLRQGKPDEALEAIAQIEKKQADNPLGPNLRGGALLSKKDVAGARAAFDQAIKLDPTYLPALVNLARLDLLDRKPADARRRLEALVKLQPKNADAHLAYADMLAKTGADQASILAALEQGAKAAPEAQSLKLALVRFHAATGDHKQALAYAQQAEAAAPDDAAVIGLLGAAQLGAGQAEQAVTTYGKLVGMQSDSAPALLLLGRAQLASGNPAAAEQSFRKAYTLKPDLPDASKALVTLKLQQRDPKAALQVAEDVQKRFPKASAGHLLAADIALRQSDWAGGIAALQRAQAVQPSPQAAVAMHAALSASGDTAGAARSSDAWIQKNPKDLVVRGYLAEVELRNRNYAAAVKQYQAMVALAPDNALLLNNLAWAAAQTKDPKALSYAEKALAMAPDNAAILDTLGMILLDAGDKAQAIARLERAVELAPKSVPIVLNLARAYARTGAGAKVAPLLERVERENPNAKGLKEETAKIRASL